MATIPLEQLPEDILVVAKKKKKKGPKKPKKDRSLRAMFRELLASLDLEKLKQPWMATKSFRLVATEHDLVAWVDSILNDPSRWFTPRADMAAMPVIAADTETFGLDTRILVDFKMVKDLTEQEILNLTEYQREIIANGDPEYAYVPFYEVKAEIAGVCLSPDGIAGIYIPIYHEDGHNIPRAVVARELQRLFDRAYLVFYNAKFDREVLRTTLGLTLRGYPYYEDVQVLHYINDPKAQLDEGSFTGDSGGLKALSASLLGYQQIELSSIGKVSANWWNEEKQKFTKRVQHVPFSWIPTGIALWYAAADAICTWCLWWAKREEAQSRPRVHQIDGEQIDTLTWIERQRWLINAVDHRRMVTAHMRAMIDRRENLRRLAVEHGWTEELADDGSLIEDSRFNVNSGHDLAMLLFSIKGMSVIKRTPTGAPSLDADALIDLRKLYPADKFLLAFQQYKEFVSLHPESLEYEPSDSTARIYLKQCTVAGGRLAAAGGEFAVDGGLGLNPQAIKGVDKVGVWKVAGRVLEPDYIASADIEPMPVATLDDSCFHAVDPDKDFLWTNEPDPDPSLVEGKLPRPLDAEREQTLYRDAAIAEGWVERAGKSGWWTIAPGISGSHILNTLGFAVCLQPGCTTCAEKHGTLIERGTLDANGILNFRKLFISPPGWSVCTTDYSNIEVRGAANISGEPEIQKIFLEGDGDHHALTASKVFPEFNDPQISKAYKKELRGRAKVINFALQYGGSEYTIYENLKEKIPGITLEDTRKMVATYWEGVPKYKEWSEEKRRIAREQMKVTTDLGRVIKFDAQMTALRIHVPSEEERSNLFDYYRLRKEYRKLVELEDQEQAKPVEAQMNALYDDPETGVRNAIDHNKFMSKIERVAVNVPTQGLAGDLMRMALNRLRKWAAQIEPMVQSVLRVHSSVHDEVDYTVKHPYMPFVVPRVTRLMKLRHLHATRKWPVPIECDTEYGPSWDVEFHLTGGDGAKPSGWTDVPGMAEYLPQGFDLLTVEALLRAMLSGKEASRSKAWNFLQDALHPRARAAVEYAFYARDKVAETDGAVVRKQLFAALHLDEYWRTDEVPDDADDTMETLVEYEARCGLTPADRGFMPPGGYLGAIPLEGTKRPEIPVLGPPPEPEPTPDAPLPLFDAAPVEERLEHLEIERDAILQEMTKEPIDYHESSDDYDLRSNPIEDSVDISKPPHIDTSVEVLSQEFQQMNERIAIGLGVATEALTEGRPADPVPTLEDELLLPAPKKRAVEPEQRAEPAPPPIGPRLQVVRDDLSQTEARALIKAMGWGSHTVRFIHLGRTHTWKERDRADLPAEFCVGESIHV
jgi:DNA polymerase I-like protein with 3'-5' exonuclease and polymerase domains